MEIINFLISIGKWILNLLSANYIAGLETKNELSEERIKLLEADNKRKEENCNELLKIAREKGELLDMREEMIRKEAMENKRELETLRQTMKKQKEEIFGKVIDVIDGFYGEITKFTTIISENKNKIQNIKNKPMQDFTDMVMDTYYNIAIDGAHRSLGKKAMDRIFEISKIIVKEMKKS